MATKPKAAAAAPAAPARKTVAPKAAAPAPVAAPEPEGEEGVEIEVGATVEFLGYGEDVPEAEQFLVAGEQYEVVALTEAEGEDPGGDPILSAPNPNFNAKKKEDPEKNPKFIEVQVFANEIAVLEDEPAEEGAEAVEAAEVAEAPAPAPAPAKKTVAAKTVAAPAAAKGKGTVAVAAPAKGKAVVAAPEPEVVTDDEPDLENEDAEVLALIEGNEDLIATAQDLEANVATTEFQLGGILFHIKKAKKHLEVLGEDGKPIAAYAENAGFKAFLADFFNVDYRKAMYLISIYKNFTLAGIDGAAAQVAQMGWTKASKIAELLVEEGSNPDELIQLAMNNSVTELSEAIKDQVTLGRGAGEKVERLTLKFRFLAEEGKSVEAILKTAQEQLGLKNLDEAFSHIVNQWASEQAGQAAPAAVAPRTTVAAKTAAKAVAAAPRRAVAKA